MPPEFTPVDHAEAVLLRLQATRRAFGEGCDTRLCGRTVQINPYARDRGLALQWNLGWWHVHLNWGCDARWGCRPLPPVKG